MSSAIDVRYRRAPGASMLLVGDDGSLFRLLPIRRLPGSGPPRILLSRRVGNVDRMGPVEVRQLVLEAFVGPCPDGMEAVGLEGDEERVDLAGVRWDWKTDVLPPSVKPRGSAHGRAKMTEAQVNEARRLRAEGWSYEALGPRFKVSPNTVSSAVRGETWKHVPQTGPQEDARPNPGVRKGAAHFWATMEDEIVLEARALFAGGGWTVLALAARYGVGKQTMRAALVGERYAEVGAPLEASPPPPPGPRARPSRKKPATAGRCPEGAP